MKIGLVSDAHGNAPGLAKSLIALRGIGVERLFFLGDAVGYLGQEREVLEILDDCSAVCLKGNHEAMLLGELPLDPLKDQIYGLGKARARIASARLKAMENWPQLLRLELDGRSILLVHGSPGDPLEGYVYPDSNLEGLDAWDADVVMMGHTHYPMTAASGKTLIINPGSCGLPRDGGGLASFAVYDTEGNSAQVYRIGFDFKMLWNAPENKSLHPRVIECLERRRPVSCGMLIEERNQ